MKLAIALFLAAGCASGQTNLGNISFTNKAGVFINQAEVLKTSASEIFYKLPNGSGGGAVKFSMLPKAIQKKYNYNPDLEAEEAERASERRTRERTREAERIWNAPAKPAPIAIVEARLKVTEENEVYWKYSYQLITRNPTSSDIVRDYRLNLLDADGYALDHTTEREVKTKAGATNTVRGEILVLVEQARRVVKPEVISKKRD